MHRSGSAPGLDFEAPDGVARRSLRLTDAADVVFEVFRPGVAERLGIGPDVACARNPRLIYGRLTGYGQDGPLAPAAGHDIDYLAVAGALEPLGRAGQPPTPINVLGDFAGGGMLMALGIVAAAYERERSGKGQVVDAAMVDGAALMLTPFYGARASGFWGERGTNMLDTGAPFYEVYECADGAWIAAGAIEPQFYAALLDVLGLTGEPLPDRDDPATWPELKQRFAAVFATHTRDEWCALADGARHRALPPILTPLEAPSHPHNIALGQFLELASVPQPAALLASAHGSRFTSATREIPVVRRSRPSRRGGSPRTTLPRSSSGALV